jgi:hypothetical protein
MAATTPKRVLARTPKEAREGWSNASFWDPATQARKNDWRLNWEPLPPSPPRVFRSGAWDFKKCQSVIGKRKDSHDSQCA